MDSRFADLEFGLVWDDLQKAFDVSLRFARGGLDKIDHPKESIDIDLDVLDGYRNNDGDYAAALTDMVFRPAVTRRFFSDAVAAAAELPVHFRLHLDGPARFHDVRWETLLDPDSGAALSGIVQRDDVGGLGERGLRLDGRRVLARAAGEGENGGDYEQGFHRLAPRAVSSAATL